MTRETPVDGELLRALALDVESSFPQLVAQYHPQLLRFVASQVKDPDLAEDILQDCWLRIYQALQRYSAERIASLELRAWLFKIVQNQMRTHLRKKNGLSTTTTEDLEEAMGDSAALSPDEIIELRSQVAAAREAVEQLPSVSRAVLTLYLFEELQYQEIATRLGLTLSNVRTHVFRGLRELRKKLAASIN